MTISAISTDKSPASIGPYSQGVRAGDFVYISGQLPINPATGFIEAQEATGQMSQCVANVEAVLMAAGLSLANVVKATIYLTDIADFGDVNDEYAAHFNVRPLPARCTIQVGALPGRAKVEIDAIAYSPGRDSTSLAST